MQTQRSDPSETPLRNANTAAGILAGLLSITTPMSAQAQDCCAQIPAPCTAYWNAAAMFVGRVEAINRIGTIRTVSFVVREGFRGVTSSTIDVATGPAGARCGLSFKVGHEYVVYADRPDGSGLTTSRCSRTRDIENAAADLSHARDVKEGRASSGHVSGRVLVAPRDLAGRSTGASRPVADLTVNITRDGVAETALTALTDQAGDYRVESRGPGTYRVTVDVPEQFYSDAPTTTVTLRDPRSCAETATVLHDNGHVAGRVVDAAGRPIAGLTLELAQLSKGRRTVTDRDGRYALTRIPPGRFTLSLPAGPSRATGGRPLRVFLPGVDTLAAATRVSLAAGERVRVPDFRIPAHHQHVAVSGAVFDADGTPAEGAHVYLKGVGEDDRIVSEPVAVDFMGRFVIAARAGADYRLFAERARPGRGSSRVDSTDQVHLTAVDGLKPMRLTLERRY